MVILSTLDTRWVQAKYRMSCYSSGMLFGWFTQSTMSMSKINCEQTSLHKVVHAHYIFMRVIYPFLYDPYYCSPFNCPAVTYISLLKNYISMKTVPIFLYDPYCYIFIPVVDGPVFHISSYGFKDSPYLALFCYGTFQMLGFHVQSCKVHLTTSWGQSIPTLTES